MGLASPPAGGGSGGASAAVSPKSSRANSGEPRRPSGGAAGGGGGGARRHTVVANKAYEDEIKSLRAQLDTVKAKHEADRRATRRAAIAYAINIWNTKSAQLAKEFLKEALRLFRQHTVLRRALAKRDE